MHTDNIKKIDSKDKFTAFLKDLATDFMLNPENWENANLHDYLESVCAWVDDYDFSNVDFSENNNFNWSKIAMVFYSGKIYE